MRGDYCHLPPSAGSAYGPDNVSYVVYDDDFVFAPVATAVYTVVELCCAVNRMGTRARSLA
jgi:hypothetical protein